MQQKRLSINPDREIVHTEIWSDSISIRMDDLNTLTWQYTATHSAPRDPALRPSHKIFLKWDYVA